MSTTRRNSLLLAVATVAATAGCAGGSRALTSAPGPPTMPPTDGTTVTSTSGTTSLPPGEGRIVGRFLAIGGPPGAPTAPQRGVIFLRGHGRTVATVSVGQDGAFSVVAPVGRYGVSGRTPQFKINGHQGRCNALHAVSVRTGHAAHANVYCQRR